MLLIRLLRLSQDVPLFDVARAVSIDTSTLSLTERGKTRPNDRALERLSKYFGLPADALFREITADQLVSLH